jgi:hypothetical protein
VTAGSPIPLSFSSVLSCSFQRYQGPDPSVHFFLIFTVTFAARLRRNPVNSENGTSQNNGFSGAAQSPTARRC